MLVQATTPRPFFDHSKHPQYLHVHTLRKVGVSKGEVFFSATVDPEHGTRDSKALDPMNEYPIEGAEGFMALEYVLPFWELFKKTPSMLKTRYDGKSAAEQGIAVGNVSLARFCTNGFQVTVKSAFRADSRTYAEHIVAFTILTPVTGGGILRLADCPFDLTNSTFDPWAPGPTGPTKNLELQEVYNRTHRLLGSSSIDARRAARVAEAEANMKKHDERRAAEVEARKIERAIDHQSGWPARFKSKLLGPAINIDAPKREEDE